MDNLIEFKNRIGLGLNADIDDFLIGLKQLCNSKEGTKIVIDFSKANFIYPSGLIAILVMGKYLMRLKKCTIAHIDPISKEVNDFLDYSGFRQRVQAMPKAITPRPDTYTIKNFSCVDDDGIEKLIDVIETELKCSIPSRNRIHENIAELILNVLQHSDSPINCYLIGQAYPKTHRIRYCIADAGIGIKKHLAKNYPELKEKNSCDAIELATFEGITWSAPLRLETFLRFLG